MQFKKAVTKIEKAQLAVACKELHPKLLYIGTKNNPPPKPRPPKSPANKLLLATIYKCYYTTFFSECYGLKGKGFCSQFFNVRRFK
jgi:hypothetical protein